MNNTAYQVKYYSQRIFFTSYDDVFRNDIIHNKEKYVNIGVELARMENSMADRKYLLSIKELKTELEKVGVDATLAVQALEKLDAHRKEKALQIGNFGKRAESIGAGLLLQLGLQEYYAYGQEHSEHRGVKCGTNKEEMQGVMTDACEDVCKTQELSLFEILSRLNSPMEATYRYGEKGKPYFAEVPLYFSISHSGNYVLAVFSWQEVGADIQYEKPMRGKALQEEPEREKHMQEERIVQRFFSPQEKARWEDCSTEEGRRKLFYRLWTRKEAYGKLLGVGIVDVIGTDMDSLDVSFEEYEWGNNYRIAICKHNPDSEIENANEPG